MPQGYGSKQAWIGTIKKSHVKTQSATGPFSDVIVISDAAMDEGYFDAVLYCCR